MRGAIVGAGAVALEGHVPGWQRAGTALIVAGTDTDALRHTAFREGLPQAHWHESLEALLAHEALEFIDICAPPAAHFRLIEQALAHGLHVLCEKPLVFDMAELAALVRHARGAGRTVHTVHNWRHAPIIGQLRSLLREGVIGAVRHCAWQTLRTGPAGAAHDPAKSWRMDPAISGGGILLDHGWHALYLVNDLLGQRPTHVSARLETRRHRRWPVEDTASVHLTYPGASAELFLTWAGELRANCLCLTGEGGVLSVEDDAVTLRDTPAGPVQRRWRATSSLSAGSYHPEWFEGVAGEFVAACHAGTSGNLDEASLCATLTALAQASSRRAGERLDVPAAPDLPRAVASA